VSRQKMAESRQKHYEEWLDSAIKGGHPLRQRPNVSWHFLGSTALYQQMSQQAIGRLKKPQGEKPVPLRPCTHKSRWVSSCWSLSALPPEADIRQRIEHVCFVPFADMARRKGGLTRDDLAACWRAGIQKGLGSVGLRRLDSSGQRVGSRNCSRKVRLYSRTKG
jgi:hypothetical protein